MVRARIFFGLFTASLLWIVPAITQPSKTTRNSTYFPREWTWTKEEWGKSDKPYLKIIQSIDRAVARKQNLDALSLEYAKIAAANPADPQAQFAWGYSAVLARKPGTYVGRQVPNAISQALATAPSPKSYQYARMRYQVLMTWGTWVQLKDLGKRLVERNDGDLLVKRHLTRLLALGTPTERQQAIVYAKQVVAGYPNYPFSHGGLGDVYRGIFYKERNVDAGYKAIDAYKHALNLNPNPEVKDDLQYLIGIINKRIPMFKK